MFENTYDLDKLAYAVAMAETGNCTAGIGPRTNNCFGLMQWTSGARAPQVFSTPGESYNAFKDLWSRKYGRYPDTELAAMYTGNDNPETWLKNVGYWYNSPSN